MAILLIEDQYGQINAIARYTNAASGDLVGMDNAIVNAVSDPIKGIIVNAVPADNPPTMLKLAGKGCMIEDTVMDGVTPGNLVWSDGDGTYSVTEPSSAAGANQVLMGYVRRIDTRGTDTGCQIDLVFALVQSGLT